MYSLVYSHCRAVHGTDQGCLSALLDLIHSGTVACGLEADRDPSNPQGQQDNLIAQPQLLLSCLAYCVHALQLAAISPPQTGNGVVHSLEGLLDAYVMQGVKHGHVTVR